MRRVFAPEKKECTRCCLAVVSYGCCCCVKNAFARVKFGCLVCAFFSRVARETLIETDRARLQFVRGSENASFPSKNILFIAIFV